MLARLLIAFLVAVTATVLSESTQHVNVRLRKECFVGDVLLKDCDLTSPKMKCNAMEATFKPDCGKIEIEKGK